MMFTCVKASSAWRLVAVFAAGLALGALLAGSGSCAQLFPSGSGISQAATLRSTPAPAPAPEPPPALAAAPSASQQPLGGSGSLSLQCRLYAPRYQEAREKLLPSMDLFVPWQAGAWPGGLEISLIWDAESLADQNAATLLSALAPYPRAFLEEMPDGLPGSYGRGVGYSRQQYSNFYADLYAGGASVVGMVDSDMFFMSPLTPADVFPPGEGGRVLFSVYAVLPNMAAETSCDIPGALGGRPRVLHKMVGAAFPVFIRTEHFAAMREHMRAATGSRTFEEAFIKTCCCQFDMMANYLWHFQRDSYVWRVKDISADPGLGHSLFVLASGGAWLPPDDADVAAAARGPPATALMKSASHGAYAFTPNLADFVCLAARAQTADASRAPGTCGLQRAAGLLSPEWERAVLMNLRSDSDFWREAPVRSRYKVPNAANPDDPEPFLDAWKDGFWGKNETEWAERYARREGDFVAMGARTAAFPWLRARPAETVRPWEPRAQTTGAV